MSLRVQIARLLAPEEFIALEKKAADIDLAVNNRVADILFKMDPFEPLLKKYNIVFSEEWQTVEDKLDTPSQMRLFMWAYGMRSEPSFKYVTDWLLNTQGNNTVRKAKNDNEWFFGRAMVASLLLFKGEVSRLASRYDEILAKKGQEFDPHLTVE